MKLAVSLFVAGCWTGSPSPAPVDRPAPTRPTPKPSGFSGGVIDLEHEDDKADARRQMAARCGDNNFTILQEGLEEVARDVGSAAIVFAWRIYYQCNT